MDLRQIFAANLRRTRHAKGISQEALAHDADVDRRYLSKIETSTTSVGLDIIARLAAVLEIDPAELLKAPPQRKGKRGAG